MDLNKKIKTIMIFATIIVVAFSVSITVLSNSEPTHTKTLEEIRQEEEARKDFEEFVEWEKSKLEVEEQCNAYIAFCNATADVNDDVKIKKEELRSEAEYARTMSWQSGAMIESIVNSDAYTYDKKKDKIWNEAKPEAVAESIERCENKKEEIEAAVNAYNAEQEAKRKAEEERKKANEAKQNNSSKKNSNSSSSGGGSSSSGSSSSSSSYSSSYDYSSSYSGGSSSYSGGSSSYSGGSSSYSGSSSSYSGGSTSYESSGLGSER